MAAMAAIERSKVQRLYDACGIIFSSSSPTKGLPTLWQLRWLQTILDAMEPIDVGIDGSGEERSQEGSHGLILGHAVREITYVHIHECQDFSIGVFCFPAGARLPLHDHPNMVVLTKVLYGSISVQSYDWVDDSPSSNNPRRSGLARSVADGCTLQSSSKVSVLFPKRGGNIHSITALSPCAILDVLAPPYSEQQGRSSSYYVSTPLPSLPGFSILEEITGVPDDLHVVGATYLGPELSFDLDTSVN
ncbi:plant cysteine oxidase 3-like [Curcuma longa]|uniref:plant cysteine oxidase 3-like n=1 Tax=Curcuma longa TaxID=136217 RepID=UPI003D9E1401